MTNRWLTTVAVPMAVALFACVGWTRQVGAANVPRKIGVGGVYVVAFDSHTPGTLYAGAGCGGVVKSTDGGDTWIVANTGLPEGLSEGAQPVVDPITPDTLYATTYDLHNATSRGVFKSTDGALTWQSADVGLDTAVSVLAIDPIHARTLYAGTAYDIGVFTSTDAAGTWSAATIGPGPTRVCKLVIDPGTPSTLYAGTVFDGVFKSTDSGRTWGAANPAIGCALAIDPRTPSTLYAASGAGVSKSTDGGTTWSDAGTGLPDPSFVQFLVIDPNDPSTLYAGTDNGRGLFKSTDGGGTWRATGFPLHDAASNFSVLAIDPLTPGTLYANLLKSTDGGDTWRATGLEDTPICGDDLRCGEECDDGNTVSGDGCDANCRVTACGNGIVTAGEQCDDGNTAPCDGCSATCQIEGVCGDGVLDTACEQCDDGNRSDADACRSDCRINVCGDGILNPDAEQCDDGNRSNFDGCRNDCTPNVCGDGVVNPAAEQCDDGNTTPCDGCTPTCQLQRCGDGHLDAECGEQCDDGNANPFDGCTDACTICGDGVVTPPEQCEDGNADPFDGCTTACTICGDGLVISPEQCDDGNLVDGDECDASCTATGCGNGVVEGDEECDDGNIIGGDGCAANCTRERARRFALTPGQSSILFEPSGHRASFELSGALTVRAGRPRGSDRTVPLAIRLHVDPISLATRPSAYLCIATASDPQFGSHNAGVGTLTCAVDGLNEVDVTTSVDHHTNDIDPSCASGTIEEAVCAAGICSWPGKACDATSECFVPHPGVCNGPPVAALSGSGPQGSAVIDVSLASWIVDVGAGSDGVPCTDDDPVPRLTVVRSCGPFGGCSSSSLLPPHFRVRLTTGTARARVIDADDVPGQIRNSEATGSPFTCPVRSSAPGDTVAGATLTGVFGTLYHLWFVDMLTTLVLGLGAPLCGGDCNGNGSVSIDELIAGVGSALGTGFLGDCPSFDTNGDERVTIDELIAGVDAALHGCEG